MPTGGGSHDMSATEMTRLVDPRAHMAGDLYTSRRDGPYTGGIESDVNAQHVSVCTDSMKAIIFGGMDGIILALIVACATSGCGFVWKMVLCAAASVVVGNAVAMGISEFLSSKAHKEYLLAEKRKELWEFKHNRDSEVAQMIDRYEAKGMSRKDAEIVVEKMAQYEGFFVHTVVAEELGIQIPAEETDSSLLRDAFIMCFSFGGFGLIALAPFLLITNSVVEQEDLLTVVTAWSLLLVAILGAFKSAFSNASLTHSVVEALILSAACAMAAYFAGVLAADVFEV